MIVERPLAEDRIWDICIVGTGPVGMAMALEFDRIGRDVLVLEAGGFEVDPLLADDSRAINLNPKTHAPMEIAVCRALGGTSWTWGGRCVAMDDIDLASRDYVPNSAWPISHDEIRQWYPAAAAYLLCGSDEFDRAPAHLSNTISDVSMSCLERWSTETHVVLAHRARITVAQHISVCLNSVVIDLILGDGGHIVDNLVVAGSNGKSTIKARNVILAAGGVETTRLLLAIQRRWSDKLGGKDGPLGRFYMGHLSGKIADIVFDNPASVSDFDFEKDRTGTYTRRRFTIRPSVQREHKLLNIAFWPDNPAFHDPGHRSGVLSAVYLALSIPPIGRRLVSEGIRRANLGQPPHRYGAHLLNVLVGAPRSARDLAAILFDRLFGKPRKSGFLIRNPVGRYALHYHGEQEPSPASRIVLADETDRFGLPRVAIDFKFTEGDAQSVISSHRVLDAALRSSGIGHLEFRYPPEQLLDRVLAQGTDGYHQVGTTRMGTNPGDSVVDPDLKVHGLTNLYIASSSVFPTTGQANSTFPAVALGLRLVHHLSKTIAGNF